MKYLAAVLLSAVSITAMAEFKTGNELLNEIKDTSNMQKIHALGYIMGVADAHYGATHCAPGSVNGGQMFDLVKNFLENAPSVRHQSADLLISKLLEKTWPCQSSSRRSPA